MFKTLRSICVLFFVVSTASAQNYEADTESVDSIIAAVYESISGAANEERDWDRFRNMFAPEAQLIPIRVTPDTTHAVFHSVEAYIERVTPYFMQNGFFEVEIAKKTERYGHMVHAFSTYESRAKADDEKPFSRGINSIQLLHDGNRWWIINIFWDAETPDQIIPATYLPN
ncbi:MAG: hypothetical protein AB8G77_09035 [Rhodothermales bacterium]